MQKGFAALWIFFSIIAFIAIVVFLFQFRSPAVHSGEHVLERFSVTQDMAAGDVARKLHDEGYVRSESMFRFIIFMRGAGSIDPGAYKIAKTMSAWTIARILGGEPYMRWVTIPEGVRKEEVVEILKANGFLEGQPPAKFDDTEGTYFPTRYLLPIDETWEQISARMRNTFNEKFAPYQKAFTEENIKWYTALKIASLVQREAAGADDMPLIAGILWNRLERDMRLQLDASIQYIRGDAGSGWWAPIDPDEKSIDSPYNTYKYSGLPPHPIANPGLDAIDAVLNPEATNCLYYIHDAARNTYCAPTFEEHRRNIEKYL